MRGAGVRTTSSLGLASAVLAVVASAPARADTPVTTATTTVSATAPVEPMRRHALYVELLGKGGLWGLGYDYSLAPRVAMGGTASFYTHDGESVLTVNPYAAIYPIGGARHRGFVQLGLQIVHLDRMSPVPEWSGQQSTGVGADACAGYELRSRLVFRAFVMGSVGKAGLSPWMGATIGVTW